MKMSIYSKIASYKPTLADGKGIWKVSTFITSFHPKTIDSSLQVSDDEEELPSQTPNNNHADPPYFEPHPFDSIQYNNHPPPPPPGSGGINAGTQYNNHPPPPPPGSGGINAGHSEYMDATTINHGDIELPQNISSHYYPPEPPPDNAIVSDENKGRDKIRAKHSTPKQAAREKRLLKKYAAISASTRRDSVLNTISFNQPPPPGPDAVSVSSNSPPPPPGPDDVNVSSSSHSPPPPPPELEEDLHRALQEIERLNGQVDPKYLDTIKELKGLLDETRSAYQKEVGERERAQLAVENAKKAHSIAIEQYKNHHDERHKRELEAAKRNYETVKGDLDIVLSISRDLQTKAQRSEELASHATILESLLNQERQERLNLSVGYNHLIEQERIARQQAELKWRNSEPQIIEKLVDDPKVREHYERQLEEATRTIQKLREEEASITERLRQQEEYGNAVSNDRFNSNVEASKYKEALSEYEERVNKYKTDVEEKFNKAVESERESARKEIERNAEEMKKEVKNAEAEFIKSRTSLEEKIELKEKRIEELEESGKSAQKLKLEKDRLEEKLQETMAAFRLKEEKLNRQIELLSKPKDVLSEPQKAIFKLPEFINEDNGKYDLESIFKADAKRIMLKANSQKQVTSKPPPVISKPLPVISKPPPVISKPPPVNLFENIEPTEEQKQRRLQRDIEKLSSLGQKTSKYLQSATAKRIGEVFNKAVESSPNAIPTVEDIRNASSDEFSVEEIKKYLDNIATVHDRFMYFKEYQRQFKKVPSKDDLNAFIEYQREAEISSKKRKSFESKESGVSLKNTSKRVEWEPPAPAPLSYSDKPRNSHQKRIRTQ